MKIRIATVAAIVCQSAAALTGDVLRCIADINDATERRDRMYAFDITAAIAIPHKGRKIMLAADKTGSAWFGLLPKAALSCPSNAGDIVRMRGKMSSSGASVWSNCSSAEFVSSGPPPEPIPVDGAEIYSDGIPFNTLLSVRGRVYDTFRDDIDQKWSFAVLNCAGTAVYVAIFSESASYGQLEQLVGCDVRACGVLSKRDFGTMCRTKLDRYLTCHGLESMETLSPAGSGPFDVAPLDRSPLPLPPSLASAERRLVFGWVVAAWNGGGRILLKTAAGELHRVDLKSSPPPQYGDFIEVSGFPDTDLYNINLSRAIWRKADGAPLEEEQAHDVTAAELFEKVNGRLLKNAHPYGRAIRLRGIVRGLPSVGGNSSRLYVESDGLLVTADASCAPGATAGVERGCMVEISGTYVIEAGNRKASNIFPFIDEQFIAVRTPRDVKVVARPPWWTTGRLLALIGALLIIILGIFGWNVALRRRAERRGRELADEQLAHVASELKVVERTRLAVELHDSLSQTLTGISMGIDSALDIVGNASEELKRQLNYTSKAVEACRTELRNCLWDLRSQALEESDMNAAIQLALSQIVSKTALNVRFAVPRTRLSDKTTHTILRIIRELATNAVRHGRASAIKIAGSIDGGKLRFSVADNGTGFDPDHAAGIGEGHFGLEGIRERVDRLDGEVDISSSPGRGTKVTVSFDIPSAKIEEGHGNG